MGTIAVKDKEQKRHLCFPLSGCHVAQHLHSNLLFI